jgi:hypothetical protein
LALSGCGSSGQTFTSPSPVSKCAVSFDAPTSTLPAAGGTAALKVKTERECQWTAQPDVAWLSITAGASGQGDGTVQFNAAANGDPVARTGGIMLNGLRAQLTQAPGDCRFDLAPSSVAIPQAGGSGRADVRASSGLCTWTAASDVDWIAITSGASGKGSGAVLFNVLPASGPPRTGTLAIAGHHFSVTQADGCTYAIAPSSFAVGAAGGSNVVTVSADTGCPWTAASDVDWISVAAAAGTGNGPVGFTVAPTTGPARTGTLTIAGQVVTVTESPGCNFDVSPLDITIDAGGGNRSVSVAAAGGCGWTAASNASWITIDSGASGDGPGTVTFTAAATTGPSRTGTITIAGRTVTVVQGQGCTFSISPDSQNVPASGGSGSVSVTAASGCSWTARSNVPWITIRSGTSDSGNGAVAFNVAATTGPARSGTMTVAGRTFTVNQGQGCGFSLSDSSATVPAGGGTGAFDVRTSDGCAWSAASSESWLTITAGATGNGDGTVRYAAAPNTGAQRTASITVASHTFTVTQDGGCNPTVAPDTISEPAGGGPQMVSVATAPECSWTAVSNVEWISVGAGDSGAGNGAVRLDIQPNTGPARNGTATIAGRTVTVNQDGACSFVLTPTSQSVEADGGVGSIAVSTSGGCGWTAVSNVPWIKITNGASGSGDGKVDFAVDPNTDHDARSGTITIGNAVFTVDQDHPDR